MNAMRKLARGIARRRMKEIGMQHICKPIVKNAKKHKSKFAEHWKEYVKNESV